VHTLQKRVFVFRGHSVVQASGAENKVGSTRQHQRTFRYINICGLFAVVLLLNCNYAVALIDRLILSFNVICLVYCNRHFV